jgi:hypothetical protein
MRKIFGLSIPKIQIQELWFVENKKKPPGNIARGFIVLGGYFFHLLAF